MKLDNVDNITYLRAAAKAARKHLRTHTDKFTIAYLNLQDCFDANLHRFTQEERLAQELDFVNDDLWW